MIYSGIDCGLYERDSRLRILMRSRPSSVRSLNLPPPRGEVGEPLARTRKGEPGGGRCRNPVKRHSGRAPVHCAPHPAFFARARSEGRPPHEGEVKFATQIAFDPYAIDLRHWAITAGSAR